MLASLFVGAPEFRAPEFRALLLFKAVAATDFNGAQSKQIRREYGFLDERGANRHQDRLALRDVTVGHASKVLALREICAAAKELACEVVELPVGDTALPHSLEPGIGAMATPMQDRHLRCARIHWLQLLIAVVMRSKTRAFCASLWGNQLLNV